MIGTKIVTLSALATLVCAGVVVPARAPTNDAMLTRQNDDDDDDNNNSNSNSQSNAACNTAIDASRANTNYCLDGNIINQLNTCLATFSGDDDEDWEETYDDPLEAIGRTCGQIARPGATLTVLISTQVATATPGATNTGILGNPNGDNDDDDDNDNGGNNTTLVSATSTPTTSVTTTVGGPAATTTGSQSNDDNNNNNGGGENTNAGDMVNAGIGGALAVVLVALVM